MLKACYLQSQAEIFLAKEEFNMLLEGGGRLRRNTVSVESQSLNDLKRDGPLVASNQQLPPSFPLYGGGASCKLFLCVPHFI